MGPRVWAWIRTGFWSALGLESPHSELNQVGEGHVLSRPCTEQEQGWVVLVMPT